MVKGNRDDAPILADQAGADDHTHLVIHHAYSLDSVYPVQARSEGPVATARKNHALQNLPSQVSL